MIKIDIGAPNRTIGRHQGHNNNPIIDQNLNQHIDMLPTKHTNLIIQLFANFDFRRFDRQHPQIVYYDYNTKHWYSGFGAKWNLVCCERDLE